MFHWTEHWQALWPCLQRQRRNWLRSELQRKLRILYQERRKNRCVSAHHCLSNPINQIIGTAFHDVGRGKLYPTIGLKKPGEFVRVNFGQTPFVYNIDDMMRVSLCNPSRSMTHN